MTILVFDIVVQMPFVFPYFLQMHSALMKSPVQYLERLKIVKNEVTIKFFIKIN